MNLRAIARGVLLLGVLAAFFAVQAMAAPSMSKSTGAACASCHKNVSGGPDLTDAGTAYKADATKVPADKGTANEYTGANKCKMCHMKQHKSWAETKHAKAFDSLVNADEATAAAWAKKMGIELKGKASENEACISCHVTGQGLPGGYPPADATLMANFNIVGCESCHGPGAAHRAAPKDDAAKKASINNKVSEAFCKTCHTAAASPNFKYEEMKGKIHPVAAE